MSEHPLLLAIDASTTSVRAIVFDTHGSLLATGRSPLTVTRLGADGYEQDATSWWTALIEATREAVALVPAHRQPDIVAMSIAHQRETVVLTDERGVPLTPALLWMDSRCQEEVERAKRNVGAVRLHALSGKPACTTPSVYKLMYLLRARPELQGQAHVHDVHSFLTHRLAGRAVCSYASADPTGLMDMRNKVWSTQICKLVGVEADHLPELVPVGYCVGPILSDVAKATGLPEHVLVYAGSGDAQAAGLGAGVTEPGRAFVDLGTAVICGTLSPHYEIADAFRTTHASLPGEYCLETVLRGGMSTLWWLVGTVLHRKDRAAAMFELEESALRVVPGSDGLITVPYWSGVMNPYWDDTARGAWIGLHPGHAARHLYRSILEGLAFELRLHIEGVEQAVGLTNREIAVLGGGSQSDLWCQLLADTLNRPVQRCRTPDASALGAAIVAAVSYGLFESYQQASEAMVHPGRRFEPGPHHAVYERLFREVYRGLYRSVSEPMAALAAIRKSISPTMRPSKLPPAPQE